MSDGIKDLQREYRRVKAPPYLAARIRAEVSQRPAQRPVWAPVTAMVTVAVIVLSVALIMQQQATRIVTPAMPSLTMLSRLTPEKPRMSMPGMTRIRSVSTPALPPRPDFRKSRQPQSYFKIEEEDPKEKDYA